MNVGELIEKLQEFRQESVVLLDTSSSVDNGTSTYFIEDVEEGNNHITVYIVGE